MTAPSIIGAALIIIIAYLIIQRINNKESDLGDRDN